MIVESLYQLVFFKEAPMLLLWIDDLLAYADTASELLDVIKGIHTKLNEVGFQLNTKKCKLFAPNVINDHGIGHDSERIKPLQRIPEPTMASD
ncbi:Hypothetical protein PHPALM_8816 [Phytophthora palmivora]|uniref:Reverse transcriptase domain-containing protein n=1 Tax=Phytophthora palmivora TaxID=4796 RepID=A0A2P4Y8W8_9STRA|nr:Hypothetical protein PHPALM_8816 [Phytophthora palmivora]